MRTELLGSAITSYVVSEEAICGFCGRGTAHGMDVDSTRCNGNAGPSFRICGNCRLDLIHHLSAR